MTKMTQALAASLLATGAFACAAPSDPGDPSGADEPPPITRFGEWRELAPRSGWALWQPACIVRGLFDAAPPESHAAAMLTIATVAGTEVHILGVSSEAWDHAPEGPVDFGFDDEPPAASTAGRAIEGSAGGGGAGPGFSVGVEADFLRRMAESATMEVYSEGAETISLDTRGAAEAIAILRACGEAERARIGAPVETLYAASRAGGADHDER